MDTLAAEKSVTVPQAREQLDIVVVGHVDHGKSTVIGRLLADTGSLPEGKLAQVKAMCERNARPFEYAFLPDALKHERAQGITIDTARCFFSTKRRNYIIHDAPGHIEFLKNMVTGAACAQAALLVIDAKQGIQENSKRHGYMLSMLGIRQLAVLINKMDLVQFDREVFEHIRHEYTRFLGRLGVHPDAFIPVSARDGTNITTPAPATPWYEGRSVLQQMEEFKVAISTNSEPFRMPVQDVYKFTGAGDDRRLVVGTIEAGRIRVDDEVSFLPSGKSSRIKSIEGFAMEPRTEVGAGHAAALTLTTQVYIRPGELMVKRGEMEPHVGARFRVSLFWMGHVPLVRERSYKLKLGSAAVPVQLADVDRVVDASELETVQHKSQVDRHDVAECVLETARPVAFDLHTTLEPTGRFVLVDDFEIAGCGVILQEEKKQGSLFDDHLRQRGLTWEKGLVEPAERAARAGHHGKLIVFTGAPNVGKHALAEALERDLFDHRCNSYYLGIGNLFEGPDVVGHARSLRRDEQIQNLGQLARVATEAGILLVATLTDVDDYDLEKLQRLDQPNQLFVVNLGESLFTRFPVDVQLPAHPSHQAAIRAVEQVLASSRVLFAQLCARDDGPPPASECARPDSG